MTRNPPQTVSGDLGTYVRRAAAAGELVVQPRMGMAEPGTMAAGLRAVCAIPHRTVGTITLDAYTRTGEHDHARAALSCGDRLNGYPLVIHGPAVTARVAAAGGGRPVQVRHGSAMPLQIFRTMAAAGLSASEGGPVSYCLPYGRTALADSVANWRQGSAEFAALCRARGLRAHLETFGGCLMGQLCPPSLLIAVSLLEGLFFVQQGVRSISLSYAQQTDARQDVEALAALRMLADEWLPAGVDHHIVLYTYMGVFPAGTEGARLLMDRSAELAVRGGAQRLIVKTPVEAVRLPTIDENVDALRSASRVAAGARHSRRSPVPWAADVDPGTVLAEARALVEATLACSDDVGTALVKAFAAGLLDVPFCLHNDNRGLTRAGIDGEGRLVWTRPGRLPLPSAPACATTGELTAERLLQMLRYTADRHDLLALDGAPEPGWEGPAKAGGRPFRIAVVGTGPRGISVLERLAARLADQPVDRPVEILAIDATQVGAGRIWRTDQPDWPLMNTVSGEVTIFSGPQDAGPARAGAGPSLYEWWRTTDAAAGPDTCAPRAVYGRYLCYALDRVEETLPAAVLRVRRFTGHYVEALQPDGGGGYELRLADGRRLTADRVVLTTGHTLPRLDAARQALQHFASERAGLHYIRGDSAVDMPLDRLPAGSPVGILGLGLSFYDVVCALTVGRGGHFTEEPDGSLRYHPSGREPVLTAGSRSGVPLPARGVNQKGSAHSYRPRLFTRERMREARRRGRLDFRRDVLPWLLAEVELVRDETELRHLYGADIACRFAARARQAACETTGDPQLAVAHVASRSGLEGIRPVDLDAMSEPFRGLHFADAETYQRALAAFLRQDLAHAAQGNVDGTYKACLDTVRDVRGVIREAVDFSGLTPESHRDFLRAFVPVISRLTTGPPAVRLRQVLALLDAGVLRIVGPGAHFAADPRSGRFRVHSPQVDGGATALDTLIDARIPEPDLRRSDDELSVQLRDGGLLTTYANRGAGGTEFATGGVDVTPSPFHPVRADGRPETGVYVLGIPSEFTRWFTQVGSGRPGVRGDFTADADAIARDALRGAPGTAGGSTDELEGLVLGERWRTLLNAEGEH